jgi:myo-inositol 2-dehydrogenase/D-chiro-inositol 1-dehydrogenase
MSGEVSVALIGAGRIGRHHAHALATRVPGARLYAIADASAEAARAAATEHGVERWTTDHEALVADSAVQAIVIAAPTPTHVPLIVAAASAGKDVFCEKPIALDLPSTDRALAAVREAGVRLQVGFQRRFDSGYRKAKELIDSGALGRVEYVRDAMRDPMPPTAEYLAASGGIFRDMTIHCFDCVRWLVGEEAEEVYATGSCLVDPSIGALGDLDTTVVTIRFHGGALATIDNSRRATFGYDVRTEVHGSKGAVFVGYSRETPVLHLSAEGVRSDHVHWFLERFEEAYAAELRSFVASILTGEKPKVTGADGRAALALAVAADESRRTNHPAAVDRPD